MRKTYKNTNSFRRALEPVTQRFVSADYVVHMEISEMDNIDRIEFSPPKIGGDDFGKFKVTYKSPYLCEVGR